MENKEIDRAIDEEDAAWEGVLSYPDTFELLDHFLTIAEAADRLGIREQRVRVLVREGRLPAHKLGRQWIIEPDDLEQDEVKNRPPGRPPKE